MGIAGDVGIAEGDVDGIGGDGGRVDGEVGLLVGPLIDAEAEVVPPEFLAGLAIEAEREQRLLAASVSWEVTKTRLPCTTGELVPQPGNFTDQRTFSVRLQRTGRLRPSATPSAFGPAPARPVQGCKRRLLRECRARDEYKQ